MTKQLIKNHSFTCFFLITAIFCISCVASNQALKKAQKSYDEAANNEQIARFAPVTLHEAKEALNNANRTDDPKEKNHLAEIVETKIKTAREQADLKANENEMQNLHKSRNEILLEGREKEVALVKKRAQQAEERAKLIEAENQAMEQDLNILQSELANLQMKHTERGLELTLKDVLFDFNKSELNGGGERVLSKLAEFVKQADNRQVLIEGFTDSIGSDSYNEQLSRRRAEVVKDYLIDKGITADRLAAKGYGEQYPVASNTTEAGRQQNRRVQVIMLKEGYTPSDPPSGTETSSTK